jgi:RNA polymerase sigma-70 factor (ECF subfamily)
VTRPDSESVTVLLDRVRAGDNEARERLIALVYPELRNIAARYVRTERADHTLQATALVHEAYARLFGPKQIDWKSRAYFFAAVATEMRRILVDYARGRNADKRAGQRVVVSLSDAADIGIEADQDLIALDEALCRFEELEPRASRVVELRFFTGLSDTETGEALGISVATVKRDWQFAKAWLFRELRGTSS